MDELIPSFGLLQLRDCEARGYGEIYLAVAGGSSEHNHSVLLSVAVLTSVSVILLRRILRKPS